MFVERLLHPRTKTPAPAPGLYHFRREVDGGRSRVHLRVDPDGHGTLVVDAARILHLNPTAAQMAYLALEGIAPDAAARSVADVYRISRAQAEADFLGIAAQVDALTRPGGPCPVCDLELDVRAPFSHTPSAPYRMDLAITYRCQNDCAHCYNARPRSFPEQPAEAWKRMIDRLWDLGIPHVVFTGGEPTLRDDLPELVAYAESKGQITGLNTNGRRIAGPGFPAIPGRLRAGSRADHARKPRRNDPRFDRRRARSLAADGGTGFATRWTHGCM